MITVTVDQTTADGTKVLGRLKALDMHPNNQNVSDYYWWIDTGEPTVRDGIIRGHFRENGWVLLVTRILTGVI